MSHIPVKILFEDGQEKFYSSTCSQNNHSYLTLIRSLEYLRQLKGQKSLRKLVIFILLFDKLCDKAYVIYGISESSY